ncbi:non-canonical purine NTP diphosphatase [uncultured Duncaniella sp.]|uniref:non-canonical purine NTP diphosphatase n=1 Tax=uncultured Duncaniella sp. TaxID=2768039 RepID=UPI00262A5999|nr:non-canonical purine NTP diphosphatase [uncultured Duncaniella sp.]
MENKELKKLVFATNNQHKLEEARAILAGQFEVVSLAEIGCHDEIPETADTLEGNSLIKARWVKEKYGYDCFADDTGLMVEALDGAPGVYSARYAGEHCTFADNVNKMLFEMTGKQNRKAYFATVISLILNGETKTFEGRVDGTISTEAHGNGGFGYDPIFIAEETGRCFAEMTPEEKNAISHRGRAMRKLAEYLVNL